MGGVAVRIKGPLLLCCKSMHVCEFQLIPIRNNYRPTLYAMGTSLPSVTLKLFECQQMYVFIQQNLLMYWVSLCGLCMHNMLKHDVGMPAACGLVEHAWLPPKVVCSTTIIVTVTSMWPDMCWVVYTTLVCFLSLKSTWRGTKWATAVGVSTAALHRCWHRPLRSTLNC